MGASLAVETAAINNRVIIKSRAKGAREIGRSVKGALFPTNRNESGNVQGPRTMRWTTENEGERERERSGGRVSQRIQAPLLSALASNPYGKSWTRVRGPCDQWLNSAAPSTSANWIERNPNRARDIIARRFASFKNDPKWKILGGLYEFCCLEFESRTSVDRISLTERNSPPFKAFNVALDEISCFGKLMVNWTFESWRRRFFE